MGLLKGRKKQLFDEVIAIKKRRENNICLASLECEVLLGTCLFFPLFLFYLFSLQTRYNSPPIQSASFLFSISLSCFLLEMFRRLEGERKEHCITALTSFRLLWWLRCVMQRR